MLGGEGVDKLHKFTCSQHLHWSFDAKGGRRTGGGAGERKQNTATSGGVDHVAFFCAENKNKNKETLHNHFITHGFLSMS